MTATPNHALQRTAPRVTVAANSSSNPSRPSVALSYARSLSPRSTTQLPRHAPPSLSLGSLGVASHTVNKALFICWFLLFVFAGCERKATGVLPNNSASIPSLTPGPTPTNFIEWEQRAKLIHVGMRREDVERVLLRGSKPDFELFGAMGAGQCETYSLGHDLVASVCYDYNGGRRGKDNRATSPVKIGRINE